MMIKDKHESPVIHINSNQLNPS